MIYEFITPSDPITFKTDDPKVAFYVGLTLGRGKAGVTAQDGTRIDTLLMFCSKDTINSTIAEQLGDDPQAWAEENRAAIADCLESFAYGSISDRQDFDTAIQAITAPEKLAAFKAYHEDKNRTSMNKWVGYAWKQAAALRQPLS